MLEPGFSAKSDRGRKARKAGISYELDIVKAFKHLYKEARRMFGQARDGDEAPDVGGMPFWVEASDRKNRSVGDKLAQGLSDSKTSPSKEYNGLPVIACTYDKKRKLDMVTMERSQFIELLEELDRLQYIKEHFS